MRVLDETPHPYRVRYTDDAAEQVRGLPAHAREALHHRVLQLADLASFAAGYALPISKIESLVADADGLSIRYQVDDLTRTLTVLAVTAV